MIALVGNDAGWTQISREQVPRLGSDVACSLAYTGECHGVLGPAGLLLTLWVSLLLPDLFSFRLSQGSHGPGGPGIDTLTG